MLVFAVLIPTLVLLVAIWPFVPVRLLSDKFKWCIAHRVFLVAVCMMLFLAIVGVVGNQLKHRSLIQEYASLQEDLEHFGPDATEMEDVYGQMVAINRKLKTSKYWNDSPWLDWFIYDEWASLEPIRIPPSRQ